MLPALLLMLAVDGPPRTVVDPCGPGATSGEIVVCKRNPVQDRYRLPSIDRGWDPTGSTDSVSRERHRLIDADGDGQDLTRGSCSAVGAGGFTGCTIKAWRTTDQQKGW